MPCHLSPPFGLGVRPVRFSFNIILLQESWPVLREDQALWPGDSWNTPWQCGEGADDRRVCGGAASALGLPPLPHNHLPKTEESASYIGCHSHPTSQIHLFNHASDWAKVLTASLAWSPHSLSSDQLLGSRIKSSWRNKIFSLFCNLYLSACAICF